MCEVKKQTRKPLTWAPFSRHRWRRRSSLSTVKMIIIPYPSVPGWGAHPRLGGKYGLRMEGREKKTVADKSKIEVINILFIHLARHYRAWKRIRMNEFLFSELVLTMVHLPTSQSQCKRKANERVDFLKRERSNISVYLLLAAAPPPSAWMTVEAADRKCLFVPHWQNCISFTIILIIIIMMIEQQHLYRWDSVVGSSWAVALNSSAPRRTFHQIDLLREAQAEL